MGKMHHYAGKQFNSKEIRFIWEVERGKEKN
jgi:hypothetical protein